MAELRVRYDSDFDLLQQWIHRGMLGGHAKKMIGYVEKELDGRWTYDEIKNYISAYKQITKAEGGTEAKVMERAVQWMILHPNPDNCNKHYWFDWKQEVRRVVEEAHMRESKAAIGAPVASRGHRQKDQNESKGVPEASRARGEAVSSVSTNTQPTEAGPSRPTPVGQTTASDANRAHAIEKVVAGGPSSSALSFKRRHSTVPTSNAMPSLALPARTTSLNSLKPAEIYEQQIGDKNPKTNFKYLSKESQQQDPKDDIDAKLSALSSAYGGLKFKKKPIPERVGSSELTIWKRDSPLGTPQPLYRQRSEFPLYKDSDNLEVIRTKLSRSASPDPPCNTATMPARPTAGAGLSSSGPQAQAYAGHRQTRIDSGRNMSASNSGPTLRVPEQSGYQYSRDVYAKSGRENTEPLLPLGNHIVERPLVERQLQNNANFIPQQRRIVSDNPGRYASTPAQNGGNRAQAPGSGRPYGRNNLDERTSHRRQSSGRYDDRRRT
ncbi:hypothetical protein EV426DRAFT_348921 [Tirmania nivea]|nr:hypothetical protein EV426DRAFT_348921 [Tirmania nivea]